MAAAVDGGDMEGIGEAIDRERAGERYHMAAIDQPASEASLLGGELVEMDARRVLVEARRDLVLRLLDGDAVDMIDAFADFIVAEFVSAAGQREVVARNVERRAGFAKHLRIEHR